MIRRFATVPMILGALSMIPVGSVSAQGLPARPAPPALAWSGEARRLPDRTQAVGSIAAVSASGTTVAAVAGFSLLVWDAATGRLVREIDIEGHQVATSTIAISRDGRRVALAGPTRVVRPDGILLNSTRVPTTFEGAVINVWDAETGRLVHSIEPPAGPSRIAFNAASYEFAAILATKDWPLTIWGQDGSQIVSMPKRPGDPRRSSRGRGPLERDVAFSRDLRRAVVLGELESSLFLWDVGPARVRWVDYFSKIEPPACVALSPDGRTVALMSHNNALSLWDFDSGKLLRVDPTAPSPGVSPDKPYYLGFDPDGRRIVSGGHVGGLRVWDVATAELRQTIQGPKAMIRDVAFLPGGRLRVISGGLSEQIMDPVLKVWDVGPAPGP